MKYSDIREDMQVNATRINVEFYKNAIIQTCIPYSSRFAVMIGVSKHNTQNVNFFRELQDPTSCHNT
jgi:hypothetical protein